MIVFPAVVNSKVRSAIRRVKTGVNLSECMFNGTVIILQNLQREERQHERGLTSSKAAILLVLSAGFVDDAAVSNEANSPIDTCT